MPSTCSQAVLNKWLNLDMHHMKQFVYIICVENGIESFRPTIDEICLMAIYAQTVLKFVRIQDLWQVMKFV